ncbi:iron-sulfur cluster assembly scaffold protein [Celeribacter baekdonensis]|jgi:NifU-like protein involved in Fe-S cluster formation|uniref:Iron-sulfur cluster assembly scaffold protein n=1 Tax=Celeribacter baekdonensis TaxID=875171 RepID=A0A2R4M1P6_9RHOB|nr:iron-sulfur cluster assembly scaffold protein [Celeribacter baekdonensis]AVW91037.1 iron-sulfur cluster assembly scaffold protein [Celeribacter baekdonensis]|tara:strand:- start:91524 stop:92015 length:492 start_codon:yes stop_codon:yes gene_type:complete
MSAQTPAHTSAQSTVDLAKLYSGKLLALAADIPLTGRLEMPQASVRERAPLCGSTVTVDLDVEDGKVVRFAQDVKACALGQAAASVLGAHVIGRTGAELAQARDELEAFLKQNGPVPSAPFEGYEALLPARDYKNRHASILLALTAAKNAFELTENATDLTNS